MLRLLVYGKFWKMGGCILREQGLVSPSNAQYRVPGVALLVRFRSGVRPRRGRALPTARRTARHHHTSVAQRLPHRDDAALPWLQLSARASAVLPISGQAAAKPHFIGLPRQDYVMLDHVSGISISFAASEAM